ncbi:putative GNAT family acetyltransferase [Poronia punctata]|nr:putative GNAT family acetyltransferase [Poronia punctata]
MNIKPPPPPPQSSPPPSHSHSLSLSKALPADATRIAEIHMLAFRSNALLHVQFPTPESRGELQEMSLRLKTLADIEQQNTTVLVVRDDDKIPVAFAKWSCFNPEKNDPESESESEWIWPRDTNMIALNAWAEITEEARVRVMRDVDCYYHLSFMGTHPDYERRGAASKLVKWGMEQCIRHHVPAYLESTLEAAPFYEKLGFRAIDEVSLEYDEGKVYKEIIFRYDP